MWTAAPFYAGLCCFGTDPFVATAAEQVQAPSDPYGSPGTPATLRLIAVGGLKSDRYDAGVELTLPPGAHTYWKQPGEAGVPPVFAFNGSENVKAAAVSFPVPRRIEEEGLDAYGYAGRVVFPVAVTPADPGKPAVLRVDMSFAVCSRLCVPGHGTASLELAPRGAGRSPELVAQALREVPRVRSAEPGLNVARKRSAPAGAAPTWTLDWPGPDAPADVFADAPEGYFFSTKKTGPGIWTLTAAQSVTAPDATKVPVTLVLAAPDGSAQQVTRSFDVGPNGE